MSGERRLRIGFVGVGAMGQCAHLRNYALLPDCEVTALAELRPQLAQRVAERHGIPRVYADHRAMLAAETLDGIVASQPFNIHGQLVPELLEAGLPVFTEKPLAGTLEAGQRILDALEKSRGWLMAGYHKRCDPAVHYARREIKTLKQSGELGTLRYVRILMPAGDWIASGFDGLIRTEEAVPEVPADAPPADMSPALFEAYTTFVNYYIHQVNLLRYLLGEGYRVTYAEPSGVLLAAQSDSGIAATIEMSPYCSTVSWQEEVLVAFERGYVKIQLPAPLACNRPGRVELFRDPGNGATPETASPDLPWEHAMHAQARAFLAAIRGEAGPPCGAAEAMEDLRAARDYIRLRFGQ